jgi:hypothetical protein
MAHQGRSGWPYLSESARFVSVYFVVFLLVKVATFYCRYALE